MKLCLRFALGLPAILALAGAAAGCDGQAPPDYQGEPLATVQGRIVDDGAGPNQTGDVVLFWSTLDDKFFVGSTAPVTGSFPADFEMPVYTPPPAAALITSPEDGLDRVGFAYILVVKKGAVDDGDDHISSDWIRSSVLGVAENNLVVYIGGDIDSDSWVAKKVGSSLSPGYHLLDSRRPTEDELRVIGQCEDEEAQAWQECADACDPGGDVDACFDRCDTQTDKDCGDAEDRLSVAPGGFDTPITVRLSSDARAPNWM